MKTLVVRTVVVIGFCLLLPVAATAIKPPHDISNGYSCSNCHAVHMSLGATGYTNACLNCHRPGVPRGEGKPFTLADAATPFALFTGASAGRLYQTSHAWSGSQTVPAAGAQPPLDPNLVNTKTVTGLACPRCHDIHTAKDKSLLRTKNDRDQMCLDCHRARNSTDHANGTHPVNVNYTGAASLVRVKPGEFNNPPVNGNPANPTSAAKLINGTILCTTCHGVHYSDSNSATFDNATSYYSLTRSAGALLRTDLRGSSADSLNICTNCHVKKNHNAKGQNIQCADCHGGHVDYMPDAANDQERIPNVYLVRRYMNRSTAGGPATKTVFLQRTSAARTYADGGRGVCEACHAVPAAIAAHMTADNSAAYCGNCHKHNNQNGAFSATGGACDACHGHDEASSNPLATGLHGPHINRTANPALGKALGCVECHAKTVSGNYVISNPAIHANGFLDYSGAKAGQTAACANFYCHSDGKGTFANPPAWTAGGSLACNGCHGTGNGIGYPDYASTGAGLLRANSHVKHVKSGAAACDACHTYTTVSGGAIMNGSTLHVNKTIDVTFNPAKATAVWTPATKTCATISCHAGGTAQWGGTLSCGDCHGLDAGSGKPMATGRHSAHVNNGAILGTNFVCDDCHAKTVTGVTITTPANHANSFVDYSGLKAGRNKSCANVYCHSDGKGTFANPPAWNSGAFLSCKGCHGTGNSAGYPDYANAGAGLATANSHSAHTAAGAASCDTCHTDTTVSGIAIKTGSTLHINQSIDIAFNPAKAGAGAAWTAGTKSCTNIYCHSSAPMVWGATLAGDCTSCHGNDAQSSKPMSTGKHSRHMNNYTTLGTGNDFGCVACHAGTVADNRTINGQGRHVNGLKNYSGVNAGSIAVVGSGSCATVYCHSTGMQNNQFWNMTAATWNSARTLDCTGCHGGPALPDGTFAAFTSVAGEPNYANGGAGTPTANSHAKHVAGAGLADSTGCARCHRNTVDMGISGKLRDYSSAHLNRSRDVTFSAAVQGRYSAATQQCVSIYCHSNGSPFDNLTTVYKSPAWGDAALTCASCHADPNNADALSGRHGKHTVSAIYLSSCDRCHNNTVDASGKIIDKARHANKAKDIAFSNGGSYNNATKECATYCHSDARGGTPAVAVKWSDTATSMTCYSCHKGKTTDSTTANCTEIQGVWSSAKGYCTPDLTMTSNGHHRLVGPQWVRKYPCYYCHNATMDNTGNIKDKTKHLNNTNDIEMATKWEIGNRPKPSYDPDTKVCDNVYCHSDGTTDPEDVRPFAWTAPKTECNSCHGHPTGSCSNAGCHDGEVHVGDPTGKLWTLPAKFGNHSAYTWPVGQEWKASLPMFPNQGAGTARANSHARHAETDFTCDQCHAKTIRSGACTTCHVNGIPAGGMGEVAHIDAAFHVNKNKDVDFRDGGDYDPINRTCSGTACHTGGVDPVWGGSVGSAVTCLSCHGITGPDVDDYDAFNGTQGKINLTQWETTGHGRYSSAAYTGYYPKSGNPAASFPGNPCWYCHDNSVIHKDAANPYRLRMHIQYERRFEKECVYCHMERTNAECIACHVGQTESLSPQATASGIVFRFKNGSSVTRYPTHTDVVNCINGAGCHDSDNGTFSNRSTHKGHNANAGVWTPEQKADVKNQYLMMGVCLQCHDDDSSNQCTSCHIAPADNPLKYSLGYDPGTGFIKPRKARASAGHFGYKHYRAFKNSGGWAKDVDGNYLGTWKGGKFCWDCHDPHGDSNIYMIQKKVATTTDGKFGMPKTQAVVTFTDKESGSGYVKKVAPFDGICNVCHSPESKHFTSNSGDGHNMSRRCTICHEHRFADSHANKQSCDSCHDSEKPIPKHTAFGLPRDCTKCHAGTVGKRMDIMGQMKANSHHVQGVEVNNKHCYKCHWEATPDGLIDNQFHTGYNYKNYTSVKNDVVDLVIYGPGTRPTVYRNTSSADGRATVTTFLASNMGTAEERNEVSNVSNHCLSCHSDQNNDTVPFDDCKTPRQYAWDIQSIDARYSQTDTITWGKYPGTANAAKKNITKSFSAHGNGVANGGGWDPATGLDGNIPNTRGGVANKNVQCFDCHNSHGSKVVGITSSYVTFNGTYNGANLKETKKDMGGYTADYKASSNTSGVNPYGAGAGQCFDCHNTAIAGTAVPTGKTPWGYDSTFGATAPIMGYKDTPRFGQGIKASTARFTERDSRKTILGGHLKASEPAGSLPNLAKDTGTASSGSLTTLDDGGKNWIADKWKNLYVLLGSGSNSGQLRKITGNTATTLTVEPFAAPVAAGDSYKIVPYSATVNGLCTPCHDPHGVSPTLGSNQAYAVPLLKGTWMTSPYKEDAPPPNPYGTEATDKSWSQYTNGWGQYPNGYKFGMYRSTGNVQPVTKHTLDRNTFGTVDGTPTGAPKKFSENDTKFAGLCLNCHKKETLTDGINRNNGAAGFKTLDRIHESVKGWGVNNEHSFTCSKCHQPHNSGLPRLMQTDCLDYRHRGGSVSTGTAWAVDKQRYGQTRFGYTKGNAGNEHRGYPIGSILGVRDASNFTVPEATTACHVARFNPTYNSNPATMINWPDGNLWNNVTPWP
ncbi:MAG: cytochrome C family [Geobacteraceae bacterium]|nr:MAG: cytochrome C family [Geobacteraceae bacterium]